MTIGITKTFKLMEPVDVDDSWLLYTDIAESDAAVWSSATTYALGARVIRITSTTHNLYESLQASNLNKTPETTLGTWWVLVSKTNRYKLLDKSESSQTVSATSGMRYNLLVNKAFSTASFHLVNAGEAYIGVIASSVGGTRKNKIYPSEYLDDAEYSFTRASITTTRQRAPWGGYTAFRLREDNTAGEHSVTTPNTVTFAAATAYTYSAYVKRNPSSLENRNARLELYGDATLVAQVNFDLGAGTFAILSGASSASITSVGDGWYRCSLTDTPGFFASGTGRVRMLKPDLSGSYTGDNTSGIYVTGFQIEEAGTLSAYEFTHSVAIFGARTFTAVRSVASVSPGAQGRAVVENIPVSVNDILEVSVWASSAGGGIARLGEFSIGTSYAIGRGTLPVKLGVIDYSVKQPNDFGNYGYGATALVKRDAFQTLEMQVQLEADEAESVREQLIYLRATPFVVYDTDLIYGAGITTFGIWRDFDIEVIAPDAAMLRLKMETLI